MSSELVSTEAEEYVLLERLNNVLSRAVRDKKTDSVVVKEIESLFKVYEGNYELRLDISLYESFYKMSGGFTDKKLNMLLYQIWSKLRNLWLQRDLQGVDVAYKIHLDGGGMSQSESFTQFIRDRFPGRKFFKTLEWCAGPGFIGFHLLNQGISDYLCLSDINEEAIECIERTIQLNKLEDRVSVYPSDNLKGIPKDEKFDLIIANPPWAYKVTNDVNPLISSDPGWKLHEEFYKNIKSFLFPGGIVCLTCYKPFDKKPYASYVPDVPWDDRPEEPVTVFEKMIRAGGLELKDISKVSFKDTAHMGDAIYFVISEYKA